MTENENPSSAPKYTCGNCLYAWRVGEQPAALCRRFPPSVFQSDLDVKRDESNKITGSNQTLAQFPVVMLGNWCGEHKREKPGAAR